MKPILYGEHEKEFNTNGIGILSDAIDCNVDIQLNGIYELELLYPVTGIHFESISQRAIILAKVDPVSKPQPFRIYRITKPMNRKVTVYARHVAYDLKGVPVSPFTAGSAPEAMQGLKGNAVTACPFSFWTDKTTVATMSVAVPSTVWNLLGGTQGSILDTYGGEYEFDRWEVKLYNHRGADRGVSIRYGKNLTNLEQDENIANCYTGIYPYWTNADGMLVQLDEKVVKAEGTFSYTSTKTVDFSTEWTEAPTQERLRSRAERYIKENGIGKPAISWKVEFVALEQTEEYRGKEILEQILLGDNVTVVLPELNINVSARAVAARYKPLLDRYAYVTLGSVKANVADTIVQQGQAITQKPSASLVQSIVMTLTATILGAKGGAVRLLDTDGDGMPDTLYVADNADPTLAAKVWRWNYEGWAGSKNGYNGPFILGATLEDGLLAEAVTAAKLIAGTIQSKDGKTFFLDLDDGILRMQATEFSISGKTVEEISAEQANSLLNDYADTVTKDIASLQAQIDGNITTWFGSNVPTGSNEPASNWTTDELRNQHLGDLFYIVDNQEQGGLVYRWALLNGVYSWHLVEDVEVAKALQQAADAKDTADGKRRVFVNQPQPPYDVGDLWAQGGNGDLMRCNTSRASGSYLASDWGLASKYIDEAKAGSIAQGKVDAQTQQDIFNKLTDNGNIQGIFSENGVWVFNAEVGKIANLIVKSAQIENLEAEKITGLIDSERINGETLNIKKGSTIAGWHIDENSIYKDEGIWEKGTFVCTGSTYPYSIGGSESVADWVFGAGGNFGVRKDGSVWMSKLHATGGSEIGGWYITENGALTSSETDENGEVSNAVYMEPQRLFYMYNQSAGDGIFTTWDSVVKAGKTIGSGLSTSITVDGKKLTFTNGVLTLVTNA